MTQTCGDTGDMTQTHPIRVYQYVFEISLPILNYLTIEADGNAKLDHAIIIMW